MRIRTYMRNRFLCSAHHVAKGYDNAPIHSEAVESRSLPTSYPYYVSEDEPYHVQCAFARSLGCISH